MQRVEVALGVNSATTTVNLQQLPLPRAGNEDGDQACDSTEPAYAVIPDRHTTALETIPQTHMESLNSSPAFSRAVGEAADLHSEDERHDEMAPAQPHPQSPAAPRRVRQGSFAVQWLAAVVYHTLRWHSWRVCHRMQCVGNQFYATSDIQLQQGCVWHTKGCRRRFKICPEVCINAFVEGS